MEQISFFLGKFKDVGLSSILIKQAFVVATEHIVKVTVPVGDISLREGTLHIKGHPALKSELYLKRELILAEVAKRLGPTTSIAGIR